VTLTATQSDIFKGCAIFRSANLLSLFTITFNTMAVTQNYLSGPGLSVLRLKIHRLLPINFVQLYSQLFFGCFFYNTG